jgi:hypothetical protein
LVKGMVLGAISFVLLVVFGLYFGRLYQKNLREG